jgi:hypothetical protein
MPANDFSLEDRLELLDLKARRTELKATMKKRPKLGE